jgi:acetyl-CoA carboxylase biotin carboxyl carrier protein
VATKRKEPELQAGSSLDVETLRQVIDLIEASEVTRLEWRKGSERLLIVRGHPPAPVGPLAYAHPVASAVVPVQAQVPARGVSQEPEPAPPAPLAEPPKEKPGTVVTSPFVGTFYRTPAPDQPPFVEVGATVRKGQVLCIIEAMKLMNEIESEVAGAVAEILVQNGQPVEFGQPLFRIEPG